MVTKKAHGAGKTKAPRKAAKRKNTKVAPKAETTTEKTAEKVAEKINKSSEPVTATTPSLSTATKLIKELDTLEVTIADLTDKQQEKFKALREALGGDAGFGHPDRGAMCVMLRNDRYFWRARPTGK